MSAIPYYSICRLARVAAILLIIVSSGCSMWRADRWKLDRYRDERAVDIEGRLTRDKPIVENPF